MKILVADDNAGLLMFVAEILRREGHEVDEAPDAWRGILFIGKYEPYDMAVLDVEMPGGGGEAVAKAARRGTPILAMSGSEESCPDWASGFIAKPFEAEDFLNQVELLRKLLIPGGPPK